MRSKEKSKFQGKCFVCGEQGHKKFGCPKIKKRYDRAQVASVPVDREVALMISQEATYKSEADIEWILDSGASRHMANDEEYFQEFKDFDEPLVIESAKKGEKLIATKEGTVKAKAYVGENSLTLSLGNVLYVKNLKFNLLSLSRLLKAGVKVEFQPDRAVLSRNGETIAVAKLRGNLFYLKMQRTTSDSAMLAKGNGELQLWHKRFSHLSFKNVRRLKQSEMVDGIGEIQNEGEFCESCAESKMIRLPFNKSRPRTTRPLERVHTDVCGQITPKTADGYQYFGSVIDDYTHFAVVYLMKRQDQVFGYFKGDEAMATAKFDQKIANLRCDLGREYFSNEQHAYYLKQGIQVESTVGYTPQHNGVAERFNRTIVEKMRTMLAESGAPKYLWGEAVLNAVYTTNRSPTEALRGSCTPAECWHGEKPDVGKLRVFGCQTFAWIPKQKRSKLDPTGLRKRMLGFAPTDYRLWN